METMGNAVKYVLRGLWFIVVFPVYALIRLPGLVWDHVLVPLGKAVHRYVLRPLKRLLFPPFKWIWERVLVPVLDFVWLRVTVPFCLFLRDRILRPLWRAVLEPLGRNAGEYIFKLLYYVIYVPLRFMWKHALRWFFKEIFLPVLKAVFVAFDRLLAGLKWLWLRLIYAPLRWIGVNLIQRPARWVWQRCLEPAARWTREQLVRPMAEWFRSWFK